MAGGYKEPLDSRVRCIVEGYCEKPKDRIFNEHSSPTVSQLPTTVLWIQWMQGFGWLGFSAVELQTLPQKGWCRGYDGLLNGTCHTYRGGGLLVRTRKVPLMQYVWGSTPRMRGKDCNTCKMFETHSLSLRGVSRRCPPTVTAHLIIRCSSLDDHLKAIHPFIRLSPNRRRAHTHHNTRRRPHRT